MSNRDRHVGVKKNIEVLLDGRTISLPDETLQSLSTVRAQLELMALRQERVLSALMVDGSSLDLQQAAPANLDFRQVHGHTISLTSLRCQIATTALRHATSLHQKTEALVPMVLINDWEPMKTLTTHLRCDFQTLIALLGFLRELDDDTMPCQPLVDHWESAHIIVARWTCVEDQKDLIALSDWLEYSVAPWLKKLVHHLKPIAQCP